MFVLRLSQVPHHTAGSWGSYWTRDPLADRLLAAAQSKISRGHDDQELLGDAEEDNIEKTQEQEEEVSSCDSDEDEASMGPSGANFNGADYRVMAKYMARYSSDEWARMTGKQRWFPFHEEVTHQDDHRTKAFTHDVLYCPASSAL
jgi:hypothetical protein